VNTPDKETNMRIQRWKHPHWQLHVLGWLQGFAQLADAAVTLGSLGFLCSSFELDMACNRAKYSFTLVMKKTFNAGNKPPKVGLD